MSLLDTAITVDGREYGSAAGVNIQRCFASYVVSGINNFIIHV